ncbi:MAG TPA: 5-formyltetrahydrofolate cyclo-ligase [Aromatoleum sp.]|uniref:5-formyltetrahydrofolate cyclo-ligase n=1 Tax=Aromatoleum sp. TaxID=2307007 RepID=UPI002B4A33EB|nr:5-formyltetrahydrofolate cyclo-ligase [Aromatoleum sp.]HJV25037.1 5-formyltetrahydrofolate cyclo-ligase [Aromatoleum sp.]
MSTLPSAQGTTPAEYRKALRAYGIATREALTAAHRSALMRPLETHLQTLLAELRPTVLGFCWPFRGEPDLRAAVAHWLAADASRIAVLPIVPHQPGPMSFRRWTPGMEMPLDRHGIPHPPEGEPLVPDVVLIPCNAFDGAGYRVGYGAGYFDRTLAVMNPVAVGLGFEFARVDSVNPQPHDRPMDWILTERGAFRVGA